MNKLYPFQERGVTRMYLSESFLLADEMGLGKTVQALEEIRRRSEEYENLRVLVVCPKSAISVWEEHIEQWLPGFALAWIDGVDVYRYTAVVTNYEQIRVNSKYSDVYWHYVICDEAHYIKNRKAKRTRAIKRLRAKYRRALTGTPMVNRPDELWSLLHWLFPREFRSYWRFYGHFVEYKVHPVFGYHEVLGPKNVRELRRTLSPFTLRRRKSKVLEELPDKYYTTIQVDLHPRQRRAYREMRDEMLAWVGKHEDEPLPAPVAIAKLTRLRQFCGSYAEIDDAGRVRMSEPSSKLDALMDIVDDSDQQLVVFSQFKQLIMLAARRIQKRGIPFALLTGDIPQPDRAKMIERFQQGGARIMLGTPQTGGVGITLTAASTVVFLDRTWSPAINLQAEDRLHRIGQKNAVQVILLEAKQTVDKDVKEKLELKWSWIRKVLS